MEAIPTKTGSNRVVLKAEIDAPIDDVFTYVTDHFDEMWAGGFERIREGDDPAEPSGKGFIRRITPPGLRGHLDEEIVTHERPTLIEYAVINEADISNHLGRIEFSEDGGATRINYTVTFDFKPSFLGPLAVRIMAAGWKLRAARAIRKGTARSG